MQLLNSVSKQFAALAFVGAAAAFTPAASAMAFAQSSEEVQAQLEAQLEAQFEETAERLDLTPQQKAELTPILMDSMEQRTEIMEEAGIESGQRPTRQQMMTMRTDLQTLQKDTIEQVSAILTDEQMEEFMLIQQERADEMRAQMQGR